MGGSKLEYTVRVNKKERVAAVLPLQEHWLPLSNLDLLLPPLDVGVFFCYDNNNKNKKQQVPPPPPPPPTTTTKVPQLSNGHHHHHHVMISTFASMVSALKISLAQALVTYYAFAGEVVTNSVGEPELLCNNRGVDFIEAYADVELRELRLYNPDVSVEKKLVPIKKEGVLCVQATELKCGGVVLACTFDHRIADAYSANMFFVAWAETAAAAAAGAKPTSLSTTPSFRKSLLSPRRPPPECPDYSFDDLYMHISSLPPPPAAAPNDNNGPNNPTPAEHAINRIYYITADDVDRIQAAATSGSGVRSSKLEAFSAYLWRIIAKAAAPDARVCRMGVVVDGRSRLTMSGSQSMANYFGNVLSIPYGTLGVEEIGAMELSEVADVVHEYVRDAATEEHFLGLIDWVEARRPEPAVARIYIEGAGGGREGGGAGPAVVVSSGQRFPVSKVDFGWGRPVFGSYHFPWEGSAGYVMPMPSARGNGDWVVYMHLLRSQVEVMEALAGDVFRRLTPDYYLKEEEEVVVLVVDEVEEELRLINIIN